jgi:hypothetical protein
MPNFLVIGRTPSRERPAEIDSSAHRRFPELKFLGRFTCGCGTLGVMKVSRQIGRRSGAGPKSNGTQAEQLLKAAEISATVMRESRSLSQEQKEIALRGLEQMRGLIAAMPESKTSKGLPDIEQAIVQPWNEESGEDAEKFWKAASAAGLDYTRRNVLQDVLKRKRVKDRQEYEVVIDTLDGDEQEGKITAGQAAELRKLATAFEDGS